MRCVGLPHGPDVELRGARGLCLVKPIADGLLGGVLYYRAALSQLGPVGQADALAVINAEGD